MQRYTHAFFLNKTKQQQQNYSYLLLQSCVCYLFSLKYRIFQIYIYIVNFFKSWINLISVTFKVTGCNLWKCVFKVHNLVS